MKLRFKVDQGEALRQGVDAPTSVVTIEVDPKTLTQEERTVLADRMDGIDVRELYLHSPATTGHPTQAPTVKRNLSHITATLPTFQALMAAIRANEEKVRTSAGAKRTIRTKKGQQP